MAHMCSNLVNFLGTKEAIEHFNARLVMSKAGIDAAQDRIAYYTSRSELEKSLIEIYSADDDMTCWSAITPITWQLSCSYETKWKQHSDDLVAIAKHFKLDFINCYQEGLSFYGVDICIDGKNQNFEINELAEGVNWDEVSQDLRKKVPTPLLAKYDRLIV